MNRITPFTLSVSNLTNLGQDRAVDFFRRLLWAEAARVGISLNLVDVPDCINVGDGGIDAVVRDAAPSNEDVICHGTNGFQIKSSDLSPEECRKELHQGNDLQQPIKPEVERILDEGGTYILVLFADLTHQKKRNREAKVASELIELGYPNPKFRIYTSNQLVGFAERFPSLVVWLKGNFESCQGYDSWSQNSDIRSPQQYIEDEKRSSIRAEVLQKLRSPNGTCPVFRLTGLSGIGKTRFVFEILSEFDLRNRVIYIHADQLLSSSIYGKLVNDVNLSAILVIDECDIQQHEHFVRSFSGRGPRLAVFTLSPEMGRVPSPTLPYHLSSMNVEQIKEIIKADAQQLPDDVVSRLGEFADGYPRIAVLLSQSYLENPSQEFLIIDDDALMDRLIGGRLDYGSDYFRKTKRALTSLSLFQKVGYEGQLSNEAQWLAAYSEIPWSNFKEIVAEQRERGIIQGKYYIYVTPFMLRIYLFKKWWEAQGFTADNFDAFVVSIPKEFRADLLDRLFSHMPYVTTTERGKEFTKEILKEGGVFSDGNMLKSRLGANFFLKLTEADPESALLSLNNTLGKWSKEQLLEYTTGRREIVWALEKICIWRELFTRAAKLLLALGEAENETYSNNASGIFTELFSLGYGPVAPTEAPPEERFPVLVAALESESKEKRMLALNACDQALESQHFSRMIGAEYQGLKREPKLWTPKTYGELFDSYRRVWQLLIDKLDFLQEEEQQRAVSILLENARGLMLIANLSNMVIDTIKVLREKPFVSNKQILERVIEILHYDGNRLSPEVRKRCERLREELTGKDYSSQLKRYVSMDLLTDKFDEDGKRVDQVQYQLEKLAQQSIKNKEQLKAELSWLMTTEAENGYFFGYEVGKRDADFSLLPTLIEALKRTKDNVSAFFLGGYFKAMFEKDRELWENKLNALAEDQALNTWVPELTWRSGMTDRSAIRVLELAKGGIIGVSHFRMFQYGGVIRCLSEKTFRKWIDFLIDRQDVESVSIAMELYYFFYLVRDSKHKLPRKQALALLTHPSLFKKQEIIRRNQMDDFQWAEIGKAFIRLYPEDGLVVADKMIEHFGEEGTILGGFHSRANSVLNDITNTYPDEVWERITKFLGPPIDSRAYRLKSWLRGEELFRKDGEGALSIIPADKIWEWVDKNVGKRAWYLASFVPNRLFREEGKICLARELLVRYGSREDVRRNLMANFSTEGWSGPASLHHEAKKQQLLEFSKRENNQNVLAWISEYASALDEDIRREKIEEEREGL
jgi:hypothetical protein